MGETRERRNRGGRDYDIDENGCWRWRGGLTQSGYGMERRARAHRVYYERFVGPIDPPDLCVLHRCDVRDCVNPEHLFLGDRGDNARDMVRKGRMPSQVGEANRGSKHTEAKIREVKALLATGLTGREVGLRTGLHEAYVSQIKTGKVWAHVSASPPPRPQPPASPRCAGDCSPPAAGRTRR